MRVLIFGLVCFSAGAIQEFTREINEWHLLTSFLIGLVIGFVAIAIEESVRKRTLER
jgi:uncharacterized membrane protein